MTNTNTPRATVQEALHLEHAFLTVGDLDRALSFYRRLFPGWSIRWSGTNKHGRAWVHFGASGEGQPSYLSLSEVGPNRGSRVDYDAHEAAIMHLGFACGDVAGLISRLREQGIEPKDEVTDDPAFLRVYYTDPDGHELELVEPRRG